VLTKLVAGLIVCAISMPALASPESVKEACQDVKASSDLSDGAMLVAKTYCEPDDKLASEECGIAAPAAKFAAHAALMETKKCRAAIDRER
jgi:hypothetical protein